MSQTALTVAPESDIGQKVETATLDGGGRPTDFAEKKNAFSPEIGRYPLFTGLSAELFFYS